VDVGGHDPELFTLFKESVQLSTVANAGSVFGVQKIAGPSYAPTWWKACRARSSSRMISLVGELVDGFLHPVEISLELLFRRLPATLKRVLAVIGVDGGCSRQLTPSRLPATDVSSSSNVTW